MSRLFGWDYPPGAANDPNAPYNQVDYPCEVCGIEAGDCICPECPVCHTQGDPRCYLSTGHGLIKSQVQIDSLAAAEKEWAAEAEAEARYWEEYAPKEEV